MRRSGVVDPVVSTAAGVPLWKVEMGRFGSFSSSGRGAALAGARVDGCAASKRERVEVTAGRLGRLWLVDVERALDASGARWSYVERRLRWGGRQRFYTVDGVVDEVDWALVSVRAIVAQHGGSVPRGV